MIYWAVFTLKSDHYGNKKEKEEQERCRRGGKNKGKIEKFRICLKKQRFIYFKHNNITYNWE